MPESEVSRAASGLGADADPVDNQLVQIETTGVVHALGTALVVTVAGEIDFDTVCEFRAAIAAGFSQLHDAQTLIIDLTRVTFMDSEGLQTLIAATQAGPREHRSPRIVADRTGLVRRSITMTGLDDILPLFDTVDDAVRTPSS